jgi:hypothetical protein
VARDAVSLVMSNQASCRSAANPYPGCPGRAGHAEFPAHIPFAAARGLGYQGRVGSPLSDCHPSPKKESCSQCAAGAKDSNDASQFTVHCYRHANTRMVARSVAEAAEQTHQVSGGFDF